eukprot:6192360-Pleurochrysis_carterae.AAC.1
MRLQLDTLDDAVQGSSPCTRTFSFCRGARSGALNLSDTSGCHPAGPQDPLVEGGGRRKRGRPVRTLSGTALYCVAHLQRAGRRSR